MKSKILVVDDEKDVRMTIDTALHSENYVVKTAASGDEATTLLETEPFDLVITDIRMPGTDGVEVLRRTKQIDDTIEVIILTGYASIENVIETLRNDGAYDYLTKPLEEIDALLFSVAQALNHRELRVRNDRLTLKLQKQNIELKRIQKALLQSEERFRTIAAITSDYFYSLSFDDKGSYTVEWIDGAFKQVTGYDRGNMRHLDDWPCLVHPEDRIIFDESVQRILSNRSSISEYRVISKDGGERWIRDYSHPIWDNGKKRVISAVGAVRDITDRVHMEEKLQQEQTFTAIAGLAGGVAHEFNNALFGITGNLELVAMEVPEEEAMRPLLQAIDSSARRMTELTRQLLAYARGGKYRAQEISFDAFLSQALPLIKHAIPPPIRLETDIPPKMDLIIGDPTQLQMMLSAILANASESMKGKGLIRIEARSGPPQGRPEGLPSTFSDNPYVSLTIKDEGSGMDETTRTRIFEPFFSTKMQGRGLGMAAVYGIVKNHGGDITVESAPFEGTTVRVFLPAKRTKKISVETTPMPSSIPGADGTVLIVDDEPVVVEIVQTILKRLGYRVLTATTGKEAKSIFQTGEHGIRLVLLDIKLPDMNGSEVLDYIKRHHPEVKVVVCSGYTLDGQDPNYLEMGADDFLQKPYPLSDLSMTIGALLKT